MFTSAPPPALETEGLTRRYGRRTALADCTLRVPPGRVVGLVGPNGAGKSTLLQLACGLIAPTSGAVQVLGARPGTRLDRVGFVAQDTPVYATLTVAEHLRLGARLNPGWDAAFAQRRVGALGLDPKQRAGRLSGGQRAQLALTVAAAKRPELLILDEPVAALDPLAREGFLRTLIESVTELGATAILSSHLLSDVERVCDHLIVLAGGRVQLAGDVTALLDAHHRAPAPPPGADVVHGAVVRGPLPAGDGLHGARAEGASAAGPVRLEELVLAYLRDGAR
ncbi:ABC transporter ATP-binding protein [Dactylosporangium maewongense]|uniref:ABC transporter ATP-binding protein n=1 Tax=Dactylosporangium maewongense TaxID=634393 RepID=A0ABP4N5A9_9ACTN